MCPLKTCTVHRNDPKKARSQKHSHFYIIFLIFFKDLSRFLFHFDDKIDFCCQLSSKKQNQNKLLRLRSGGRGAGRPAQPISQPGCRKLRCQPILGRMNRARSCELMVPKRKLGKVHHRVLRKVLTFYIFYHFQGHRYRVCQGFFNFEFQVNPNFLSNVLCLKH